MRCRVNPGQIWPILKLNPGQGRVKILAMCFRATFPGVSAYAGKTELSTTTVAPKILADLAKGMVDMLFLCFPGFGYLP